MGMSEREVTIERIERILNLTHPQSINVTIPRLSAERAVSLLKEQEPLAVYEDKVNECVCGNGINRFWHPEYCGFCGKKLLWY